MSYDRYDGTVFETACESPGGGNDNSEDDDDDNDWVDSDDQDIPKDEPLLENENKRLRKIISNISARLGSFYSMYENDPLRRTVRDIEKILQGVDNE